jgi:hypothetical protein
MGRELLWSNSADRFDAIAHIIPARTKALGQGDVGGEISIGSDLKYSSSNHDHSAVFHGYFGDKSKGEGRKIYWENILTEVFQLANYSGLNKYD